MFCPSCNAEYRQGFTRCADCEVDLVEALPPQRSHRPYIPPPPEPDEQEPRDETPVVLWRGNDPVFYTSLIQSIANAHMVALGGPAWNAQPLSGLPLDGSSALQSFQVQVPVSDLLRAQMVLNSVIQDYETEGPDRHEPFINEELLSSGVMICPLCFGQFQSPGHLCPACNTPLRTPAEVISSENPAVLLWYGYQADFWQALIAELQTRGMIHFYRDMADGHNVGTPGPGRFWVSVLESDLPKAKEALSRTLAEWHVDTSAALGVSRLGAPLFWPPRAELNGWLPEELTIAAWAGNGIHMAEFVGAGLRELEIPYKREDDLPVTLTVFVHPEDEDRARELVQQISEGAPPEGDA